MYPIRQIIRCAVLLGIAAGFGVAGGLRAQSQAQTQNPNPPFSLTITSDSPVKSGKVVWVDVTLKNITSGNITTYSTSDHIGFEYEVDVWTDKSAMAPETKFGREIHNHTTPEDDRQPEVILSNGAYSELGPGKSITDHVSISKMYDLSKPGKYTIQFRRLDEVSKTLVKSNKLTVTITP